MRLLNPYHRRAVSAVFLHVKLHAVFPEIRDLKPEARIGDILFCLHKLKLLFTGNPYIMINVILMSLTYSFDTE